MSETWKSVEVFLRDDLSRDDLEASVRTQILCTASECGEFVRGIRIGSGIQHGDGWAKWNVSYLPGPPGVFRG